MPWFYRSAQARRKMWAGGDIIEHGEVIGRVALSGRIWAAIPATVRRVAARFSELLFEHVGAESMREIARRNAAETAACVCHAHDFTDANMLMLEAMVNVVGRHANDDSPAMLWLFDVAWHHARMTWHGPIELGAPLYLLVVRDGAQLELHGPYGDEGSRKIAVSELRLEEAGRSLPLFRAEVVAGRAALSPIYAGEVVGVCALPSLDEVPSRRSSEHGRPGISSLRRLERQEKSL